MDNQELISAGIDIGGTKISAAVVFNGKIVSEVLTYKTPDNIQEIQNITLDAIESLKELYSIKCVGIATAGTVNIKNTKVTGSTGNLPQGYSSIEFTKIIGEKFNIKTYLENDANAAAYAEYKVGNAKGDHNTVIITLGTGIGGGIIVNGKLLRGKSGAAAEVGHIPINIKGKRPCTCGAWDCWESYASGTGFAKNAQEMAKELSQEEKKLYLGEKDPESLTTYDVIEGLKQDNSFAIRAHETWECFVLVGLVALANIFDPDSIILSGGMAKFSNLEKLNKELDSRIVTSKVKLLPAKAGNYAGIIGAAILAQEKFIQK